MGIINRFLLFVYATVALLVALFAVAFAARMFPEDVIINEIRFFMHQQPALIIFACLAVFSLYFMLYAFFVGGSKESAPQMDNVIIKTKTGEVRVAKSAIEALTDREATSVSGVRESESVVAISDKEGEAKLSVKIALILLAGANVPKISEEVTASVQHRIFESLAIEKIPVDLSVRELNSAPAENQKRVH